MSSITTYKLTFLVPPTHLEQCKTAIFAAGAGAYPGGLYSQTCFETTGTGQFLPSKSATPHIGEKEKLERIQEIKVETICVGEGVMRLSVAELRKAHPYEVVAIEVLALVDI